MKIGGLRGDILFKSKEYPLALPKKDSRGDFEIFPRDPLETTKGRGLRPPPLESHPWGGWAQGLVRGTGGIVVEGVR